MSHLLDRLPADILKELLDETDRFAVENVRADRGGPFGSSIHVYDLNSGTLTAIGDLEANAVLATGMGSAHAEDQAMNPETITALKDFLRAAPETADHVVLFSSSGESCPACHAKEEILSRSLIEEGLLAQGRFVVTYGATFEDTANIAGFNDAPYHDDMQKPRGAGMISVDHKDASDIPAAVARIFEESDKPVSVIVQSGGQIIAGYADRDSDLMATSEVSAIRSAARAQKADGVQTPWDLDGATLYTSTSDVGPLGYAECQWANVTGWVAVEHPRADDWATQEARGISNTAFFDVIAAKQYNDPSSRVAVKRIEPFENKAQHAWRKKLDDSDDPSDVLYNGIACD